MIIILLNWKIYCLEGVFLGNDIPHLGATCHCISILVRRAMIGKNKIKKGFLIKSTEFTQWLRGEMGHGKEAMSYHFFMKSHGYKRKTMLTRWLRGHDGAQLRASIEPFPMNIHDYET